MTKRYSLSLEGEGRVRVLSFSVKETSASPKSSP
jgi:hypothetical protein